MRTRSLLRQYRLWMIILVAVPCLVVMGLYTVVQVQTAQEEHLNLMRQRVESQKRLIDLWIDERAVTVKELSMSDVVRNLDPERMEEALYFKQQYDKNFDSLSYIDKNGIFRQSTLNKGISFPDANGRPYYEKARTGYDYISGVVIGRNSGQAIINFSAPVYDYDENFQGLVLGSVKTATLSSLFRENWSGNTGQMQMINRQGFMLVEPRFPERLKALGLTQDTAVLKVKATEELRNLIQQGSAGSIIWTDLHGKKVLGYYIDMPERGWTLYGRIEEAEVMAPIYRQLAVMSGGGLLLLLLVLPLASLRTNQIKVPVEWLLEQAELVASENYNQVGQQKYPEKMPAELETLCDTFIQMSRKIDSTVQAQQDSAAKIAASERRYHGLFTNMQDMFALRRQVTDAEGRITDWEYIAVNPAFERMYGIKAADIIGKTAGEAFAHYEDNRRFIALFAEVISGGHPLQVDFYHSGIDRWLRLSAYIPEPGYVATVAEDITAQRQAETALIESEARFKELMKQSSEAIVVYALETGRIIEVNEAAVEMFGYTEGELLSLLAIDLTGYENPEYDSRSEHLLRQGSLPTSMVKRRRKDGSIITVERTGSMIRHHDKELALFTYHHLSAERKLQEKVQKDVETAGMVQKAMLQGDYQDEKVTIRTIFCPAQYVSGDYYGYQWSADGDRLSGFLLDVTGHGLATALQTSAVTAIFKESMVKDETWSADILARLNAEISAYLPDGSFAAAMVFSLDVRRKVLTCISAGINYFLASTGVSNGWVCLPGRPLGIGDSVDVGEMTLPVQHADTFFFLTDGITDRMSQEEFFDAHDFGATVGLLEQLATDPVKRDDSSGLCLQFNGRPNFPLYFELPTETERQHIRPRVQGLLTDLANGNQAEILICLGEAVMNAFEHGKKARVKVNKIGNRLILRVREDGPGFPGNEYVAKLKADGLQETFAANVLEERGRGIPLMLSFMDSVIYNRQGNEVMLVKKMRSGGVTTDELQN